MEILTGEYLSTCTVIQTMPLFVYGQITGDPLPHTSQHPNVLQKQRESTRAILYLCQHLLILYLLNSTSWWPLTKCMLCNNIIISCTYYIRIMTGPIIHHNAPTITSHWSNYFFSKVVKKPQQQLHTTRRCALPTWGATKLLPGPVPAAVHWELSPLLAVAGWQWVD